MDTPHDKQYYISCYLRLLKEHWESFRLPMRSFALTQSRLAEMIRSKVKPVRLYDELVESKVIIELVDRWGAKACLLAEDWVKATPQDKERVWRHLEETENRVITPRDIPRKVQAQQNIAQKLRESNPLHMPKNESLSKS